MEFKICLELLAQIPDQFELRPLRASDYDKGFLDCLAQLTTVGKISPQQFREQYSTAVAKGDYFIAVIEDRAMGTIAAAGTVLLEHKFIHECGKVGHVEDIVVRSEYRGKHLGQWIIEQLKYTCKMQSCYKIILDCSEGNVKFYEKCGFRSKERQMVLYL